MVVLNLSPTRILLFVKIDRFVSNSFFFCINCTKETLLKVVINVISNFLSLKFFIVLSKFK